MPRQTFRLTSAYNLRASDLLTTKSHIVLGTERLPVEDQRVVLEVAHTRKGKLYLISPPGRRVEEIKPFPDNEGPYVWNTQNTALIGSSNTPPSWWSNMILVKPGRGIPILRARAQLAETEFRSMSDLRLSALMEQLRLHGVEQRLGDLFAHFGVDTPQDAVFLALADIGFHLSPNQLARVMLSFNVLRDLHFHEKRKRTLRIVR